MTQNNKCKILKCTVYKGYKECKKYRYSNSLTKKQQLKRGRRNFTSLTKRFELLSNMQKHISVPNIMEFSLNNIPLTDESKS